MSKASEYQPKPKGDGQIVLGHVIADLNERALAGFKKYGTYLRTYNGRDAMWDAYQECLDMAMYIRQAILEVEEAQRGLQALAEFPVGTKVMVHLGEEDRKATIASSAEYQLAHPACRVYLGEVAVKLDVAWKNITLYAVPFSWVSLQVSAESKSDNGLVELYCPFNSTEGMDFMEHFCDKCKHEGLGDGQAGKYCPIAAQSMRAGKTSNSEYPNQWRYDSAGFPTCNCFVEK